MSAINFNKLNGLVPCIVQDATTHNVLMLGFMNEEAYEKTMQQKKVTFFSRSKNRLWTKGETSNNYLHVVDVKMDCDQDTILIKATPTGPVCHTGADTCFMKNNMEWDVRSLERIIQKRKSNPTEGSYTTSLFESGIKKIAQKVGEEAVELILEADHETQEQFLNEAADLLYHYLVLLASKNTSLADVESVLKARHQSSKS